MFFSSIILWSMTLIIISGIRQESWVNIVGTVRRLVIVTFFIIIIAFHFHWKIFMLDFIATHSLPQVSDTRLGSLSHQVINSLPVTLWAFVGVERAVVLSGRAVSQYKVEKTIAIGFFTCLVLFVLVSLLPLGIISYGTIAQMISSSSAENLALVLHNSFGHTIMAVGLIISVFSSWLTWTMVLAEMPFTAAKDETFPHIFSKANNKNVLIFSLIAATIVMQLIIFISHFANNAFQMA